MKKLYSFVLFLIVFTGLNAQVGTAQLAPEKSTFEANNNQYHNAGFEKATIWSNDISVASDWTYTNTSLPSIDWYIETDSAAVPNNGPVEMTTASNGYLMINSDSAGQGATQNAYATYAGGSIDLTGMSDLRIEFQQHYRIYQDERSVEISNDGGLTWTAYTITDGTEAGGTVFSGVVSIDISASAGNQSNVSIRFHYVGSWAWHWAVDDIFIKSIEPFDLKAEATSWGVIGSYGYHLPYYTTPTAQIQPINFCGINKNIGLNDIADATYSVEIPSETYSATGTINSGAGATDTICASADFTPTGVGSFTATATMSTTNPDTGTFNNTFDDVTFGVDPFLYARDNSSVAIDGYIHNEGQGFELGNVFDIFADADLTAIRVGIDASAVVGASIFVKLYTVNSMGDFIFEDESINYVLIAADTGSFINLRLANGVYSLAAGESYLVTVGSNGDGALTNDLAVMTSGDSEPHTSFFFDHSDWTWDFSTSTPVVQMNFDPAAAINKNSNMFGIDVYPNPTNDYANVSFSLNNAADVNITVTDLSGKVVYSNVLGKIAAGTTEVVLNTAALSNGVYMINVAVDNRISTEKLIVQK